MYYCKSQVTGKDGRSHQCNFLKVSVKEKLTLSYTEFIYFFPILNPQKSHFLHKYKQLNNI